MFSNSLLSVAVVAAVLCSVAGSNLMTVKWHSSDAVPATATSGLVWGSQYHSRFDVIVVSTAYSSAAFNATSGESLGHVVTSNPVLQYAGGGGLLALWMGAVAGQVNLQHVVLKTQALVNCTTSMRLGFSQYYFVCSSGPTQNGESIIVVDSNLTSASMTNLVQIRFPQIASLIFDNNQMTFFVVEDEYLIVLANYGPEGAAQPAIVGFRFSDLFSLSEQYIGYLWYDSDPAFLIYNSNVPTFSSAVQRPVNAPSTVTFYSPGVLYVVDQYGDVTTIAVDSSVTINQGINFNVLPAVADTYSYYVRSGVSQYIEVVNTTSSMPVFYTNINNFGRNSFVVYRNTPDASVAFVQHSTPSQGGAETQYSTTISGFDVSPANANLGATVQPTWSVSFQQTWPSTTLSGNVLEVAAPFATVEALFVQTASSIIAIDALNNVMGSAATSVPAIRFTPLTDPKTHMQVATDIVALDANNRLTRYSVDFTLTEEVSLSQSVSRSETLFVARNVSTLCAQAKMISLEISVPEEGTIIVVHTQLSAKGNDWVIQIPIKGVLAVSPTSNVTFYDGETAMCLTQASFDVLYTNISSFLDGYNYQYFCFSRNWESATLYAPDGCRKIHFDRNCPNRVPECNMPLIDTPEEPPLYHPFGGANGFLVKPMDTVLFHPENSQWDRGYVREGECFSQQLLVPNNVTSNSQEAYEACRGAVSCRVVNCSGIFSMTIQYTWCFLSFGVYPDPLTLFNFINPTFEAIVNETEREQCRLSLLLSVANATAANNLKFYSTREGDQQVTILTNCLQDASLNIEGNFRLVAWSNGPLPSGYAAAQPMGLNLTLTPCVAYGYSNFHAMPYIAIFIGNVFAVLITIGINLLTERVARIRRFIIRVKVLFITMIFPSEFTRRDFYNIESLSKARKQFKRQLDYFYRSRTAKERSEFEGEFFKIWTALKPLLAERRIKGDKALRHHCDEFFWKTFTKYGTRLYVPHDHPSQVAAGASQQEREQHRRREAAEAIAAEKRARKNAAKKGTTSTGPASNRQPLGILSAVMDSSGHSENFQRVLELFLQVAVDYHARQQMLQHQQNMTRQTLGTSVVNMLKQLPESAVRFALGADDEVHDVTALPNDFDGSNSTDDSAESAKAGNLNSGKAHREGSFGYGATDGGGAESTSAPTGTVYTPPVDDQRRGGSDDARSERDDRTDILVARAAAISRKQSCGSIDTVSTTTNTAQTARAAASLRYQPSGDDLAYIYAEDGDEATSAPRRGGGTTSTDENDFDIVGHREAGQSRSPSGASSGYGSRQAAAVANPDWVEMRGKGGINGEMEQPKSGIEQKLERINFYGGIYLEHDWENRLLFSSEAWVLTLEAMIVLLYFIFVLFFTMLDCSKGVGDCTLFGVYQTVFFHFVNAGIPTSFLISTLMRGVVTSWSIVSSLFAIFAVAFFLPPFASHMIPGFFKFALITFPLTFIVTLPVLFLHVLVRLPSWPTYKCLMLFESRLFGVLFFSGYDIHHEKVLEYSFRRSKLSSSLTSRPAENTSGTSLNAIPVVVATNDGDSKASLLSVPFTDASFNESIKQSRRSRVREVLRFCNKALFRILLTFLVTCLLQMSFNYAVVGVYGGSSGRLGYFETIVFDYEARRVACSIYTYYEAFTTSKAQVLATIFSV